MGKWKQIAGCCMDGYSKRRLINSKNKIINLRSGKNGKYSNN